MGAGGAIFREDVRLVMRSRRCRISPPRPSQNNAAADDDDDVERGVEDAGPTDKKVSINNAAALLW